MKYCNLNSNDNRFFIDDNFFSYDNGCVFLWFGDLWIDGDKFTKEHFHNTTSYIMNNITGSGVFLCLSLDERFIECYTTTHNSCYVFISKNNKNINISIGIHNILNREEKPEINHSEIKNYILSDKLFHDKTIFNDVVFFKPGFIEKMDFNLKKTNSFFRCGEKKTNDHDFFSMLKNNISSSFDGRDIGIYYSGGFDSTLLLYIMKEMGIDFNPYYKELSNFSNNGELYSAERKCRELGVKLIKIKETLDYSLEPYFEKKYDFPHQVSICLSYNSLGGKDMTSSPIQFFCGHGGDAVFGQNSIGLSCVDAFKEQGFFMGLKKMIELAILKGMTLKDIVINLHSERKMLINHRPGRYEQVTNIIESVYSKNGMNSDGKINIFSPILFENIIEYFLGFHSYQHFNARYDRALMREMANNRYNDPFLFNCSKYASSNIIFNILNAKKEQIRHVVNKTKLLQSIGISDDEFNEKLLYQSRVMYIPKDYLFIHKLYQTAVFLLVNDL